MQADSKTARQSNMELLRIFAAAGVIALHFNARALQSTPPPSRYFLLVVELAAACSVNVFVMLSGYFLWRREHVSVRKPLSLLVQLIVYRLVMHGIELILGSAEFTWEGLLLLVVPTDYFLVLYAVLYLLSPYLNRLIALQDDRGLRRLLLLLLLLFSVWNYAGLFLESLTGLSLAPGSSIGIEGAQDGYTIVNFILCYCVGAAISRKSLAVRRPGLLLLGCFAAELLLSRLGLYFSISYLSPFVICQAACAVLLAERVCFRSRIVNCIAGAALSVYMIHMHLLARFDPASCAGRSLLGTIGYLTLTVAAIYAAGVAANVLYTALVRPVGKYMDAHVRFPEISC